jgi:hypothetical protein
MDFESSFLQAGNKHTDFSSLSYLALGGGFGCDRGINADAMEWLAHNCSLPRFKALRIRLDRDDN